MGAVVSSHLREVSYGTAVYARCSALNAPRSLDQRVRCDAGGVDQVQRVASFPLMFPIKSVQTYGGITTFPHPTHLVQPSDRTASAQLRARRPVNVKRWTLAELVPHRCHSTLSPETTEPLSNLLPMDVVASVATLLSFGMNPRRPIMIGYHASEQFSPAGRMHARFETIIRRCV